MFAATSSNNGAEKSAGGATTNGQINVHDKYTVHRVLTPVRVLEIERALKTVFVTIGAPRAEHWLACGYAALCSEKVSVGSFRPEGGTKRLCTLLSVDTWRGAYNLVEKSFIPGRNRRGSRLMNAQHNTQSTSRKFRLNTFDCHATTIALLLILHNTERGILNCVRSIPKS